MVVHEVLTNSLFTFVAALLIVILVLKWIREWNYPPGPKGIPVLGYSIFLGAKPNETLRDLSKKYGDIFSFYIGPKLHICVTDYHIAKDLLTHPLMLNRPPGAFDFIIGGGGFSGKNGQEWQEQRRFTFFTMRNLGLGKGLWETMIHESAEDFVNELKNTKGKPVNYENILSLSQISINVALLFGRHLNREKDGDNIELIQGTAKELMKYFSSVGLNISLPWLTKFLYFFRIGGYHKFFPLLRQFEDIFRKEVERRMKSPESMNRDDFIGCYFREMQEKEKEGAAHTFSVETMLGNLFLLFIAGNDTTMASLSWLLLLMATHQDVQKKVHDEIDKVFGKDSSIYHEDKFRLPYTMATIFEMARWVSISPVYPPRYAADTFSFNGYTIPKGCHVITNIWSIMRDPRYFEDPDEFRPERFLSENGEKILKLDGYAPFSFGKRNCPGEGVAVMTIFLYFVIVMQKLKVATPPGCRANLEPIFGGAHMTHSQNLCFTER